MHREEIINKFKTGDKYECYIHSGKDKIEGIIVIQGRDVFFLHNNSNCRGSTPAKMPDGYKYSWIYAEGMSDMKIWKDIPKEQVVNNYEIY